MSKIVTRELRLLSARNFQASISVPGAYYLWVGNHVDPSVNRPVFDDVYYTSVDPYRNMEIGKAITSNDVTLLVRSIPYVANVVYTMYDDQDPELFDKDFYVTVQSGDFTHVFKCLYNNQANASTIAPDFGDVDPGDQVYITADEYQWKYMYTVDDVALSKFSTPGYIPVVPNTSVEEAVRLGSIDVIHVEDPGKGYDNYLNGTFGIADISVFGNSTVYSVASNVSASASNGFYTGCVLYLSSGTGVGQFRTVTDYQSNSGGRFVVVDKAFVTSPTNGTQWELTPKIEIEGTGEQTLNAAARAIINTIGNTIQRVEMLDVGLGYTVATATVLANSSVAVPAQANVRVIAVAPGGHGYDSASELGCTRVAVSALFNESESNTIPTTGEFGQFGLMTRPTFSSANLGFSSFGGIPDLSQSIHVLSTTRIRATSNVVAGSNTVIASGAEFDALLGIGDLVYINDGSDRLASYVMAVNSSTITLNTAADFTSSNTAVYKANVTANATISHINQANSFVISGIRGDVAVGDEVIVLEGGAWGVIDFLSRGGVEKDMNTFIGMHKVVGSYVSGVISDGDTVTQGSTTASVHSVQDSGGVITVYLTRVSGPIDNPGILTGNSGGILSISDKYDAEIVSGSGRLIYIENIEPVERGPTQKETFVFVLEF